MLLIKPKKRQLNNGSAELFLIIGGGFQKIAEYPEAAVSDIVAYFDVPSEVDGASADEGVATFIIGKGETLGTLLETYGFEGIRKFFAKHPGINLNGGLAQVRAVGAMAVRKLLEDLSFRQLLRKTVIEPLQKKHNGAFSEINLNTYSTANGGTGSPCASEIVDFIAKILHDITSVPVTVNTIRVGALSFVGVPGDRINSNAAATFAEDLNYTLYPTTARMIRTLTALELPMVACDGDSRSQFGMAFTRAYRSSSTRMFLERSFCNESAGSRFGNVTLVRPGFWDGLSSTDIAAESAAKYLSNIKKLYATKPDQNTVTGVSVECRKARSSAKEVDELIMEVRESHGVKPAELEDECAEPTIVWTDAIAYENLIGDDDLNLGVSFKAVYGVRCRISEQFVTSLGHLRALLLFTEKCFHDKSKHRTTLLQRKNKNMASFAAATNSLYPQSILARLKSIFGSPDSQIKKFKSAIIELRQTSSDLQKIEIELEVLLDVKKMVTKELDRIEKQLQDLISVLRRCVHRRRSDQKLTEVIELDHKLGALINAGTDPRSVIRVLCTATKCVTMAGLQRIVGADDPYAHSIVDHLLTDPAPVVSPEWGGTQSMHKGRIVYVIPPLTIEAENEFRSVVISKVSEASFAIADSASTGVSVVSLEIRKPIQLGEILTPFYRKELEQVIDSPVFMVKDFDRENLAALDHESNAQWMSGTYHAA